MRLSDIRASLVTAIRLCTVFSRELSTTDHVSKTYFLSHPPEPSVLKLNVDESLKQEALSHQSDISTWHRAIPKYSIVNQALVIPKRLAMPNSQDVKSEKPTEHTHVSSGVYLSITEASQQKKKDRIIKKKHHLKDDDERYYSSKKTNEDNVHTLKPMWSNHTRIDSPVSQDERRSRDENKRGYHIVARSRSRSPKQTQEASH
eukprot:TRINITY_DN13670_c0_g1_i1.p1 TRINITY_DN13670_c0_g1~~TRINITY_DN13670_c0_g1_i1.p1  ORF type:complete len:203 (+),score=22.43 TRINITY_DN13670_c0_g1_i1:64-672(+)